MRSTARLRDRLGQGAPRELFGREQELEHLCGQLQPGGAVVTFVHGMGGIGKSALLDAAQPRLQALGARVLRLDARDIEPTPAGFLRALGGALGSRVADVETVGAQLEAEAASCVWLVDEFDRLRLLDDWLRHTLLPSLPERTRWVFAGRFAPRKAWLATPGWSHVVLPLKLVPLTEAASRAVLEHRGVAAEQIPQLLTLARGTPLALTLMTPRGVSLVTGTESRGPVDAEPTKEDAVLAALAERCVEALPAAVRAALEAASVVRRVTRPLLEAMLAEPCEDELLNELSELSFVEHTHDGLTLHETVRQAMASRLRTLDPVRHRSLRLAAWRAFEEQLCEPLPVGSEAWRLLADMLFVVDHAEIREAFFPTQETPITMDRALPQDHAALRAIVARHEPPAWLDVFEAWWHLSPAAFRVARDTRGDVLGFAMIAKAHEVPHSLTQRDPMLQMWQADLQSGPGRERGALFLRRSLAAGAGEAPDEVRAAIWLDAKRCYVERPRQWALYLGTRQLDAMPPRLAMLGFERAPLVTEGEGTLRLKFGAAGIWSWLRGLVNTTPAEAEATDAATAATAPQLERKACGAWRIDRAARGLIVDGRRVALSALEYQVLLYLLQHSGRVVTRNELLEAVWQQRHTGSNVVDAVIRLLRKKLGAHAVDLDTVRGHGYRLVTASHDSD